MFNPQPIKQAPSAWFDKRLLVIFFGRPVIDKPHTKLADYLNKNELSPKKLKPYLSGPLEYKH